MITVEVFPYHTFREKIRITKEIIKTVKPKIIEIYPSFIYTEKQEDESYV